FWVNAVSAQGDPEVKFGPIQGPAGTSASATVEAPSAERAAVAEARSDELDLTGIERKLSRVNTRDRFRLRGAKEARVYATASTSVVLVVTKEGFGSGSVVGSPQRILTNWHVVAGLAQVGIVFKSPDGAAEGKPKLVRAKVVRIDEVADLALLEVESPLPSHVKSIPLGKMTDAQVGADVHAIGHPTGETWTYTKGLISQIRKDYQWQTGPREKHRADVIQTQTPINPGNSGGPLLTDEGRLVGVNSFKAEGEALNFAVGVNEVERFLAMKESRAQPSAKPASAAPGAKCESRVLGERRTINPPATIRQYDSDCDGKPDALLFIPDDRAKGIELWLDRNGDGQTDVVIVDNNRDGKWDISFHDTDFDGKPDLIGHHPDGRIKPSSFEPYVAKR
ncbi:MAG: trypsin-like peptidase domain-containing protein, partial [Burkholderiales bacterium]